MARSLSRFRAILLAVVFLGAAGLVGWVLFGLGDRLGWGGRPLVVNAAFLDLQGVEVGTRVRIQGIDAGEVEAILPPDRPGKEIQVRLRIVEKVRHLVRQDAKIQVVSDNLLGTRSLRLLPGNPEAPPTVEGAVLPSVAGPDMQENLSLAAARLTKLLYEMETVVGEVRQGQGTVGAIAQDLGQATARLNKVLSHLDVALADLEQGKGTLGQLLKDDRLYQDLAASAAEMKAALGAVREGQGTLGKLLQNGEAYQEALTSIQDVRKMVSSVRQNADALKALPFVRNYVVDAHKELVRPECERYHQWLPSNRLFEKDRAILTEAGKKELDQLAGFFQTHKEPNSEVVIASFAGPEQDTEIARTLTQRQSEAVMDYLQTTHRIHRMGWWWFSNRTVKAIGVGNTPPALPEAGSLPPARVEFLVFIPTK